MSGTCIWRGEDGTTYEYRVFEENTAWNDVPGNYIFAKLTGSSWTALYIGQTSSFRDRLPPHHERWAYAKQHGATHIHAHTGSENERIRRLEEMNLIRYYTPLVNRIGS